MLTKTFNFNCLKPIYRGTGIPSLNDVLNIIWNGDANNSSGYSQGARDFLFALNKNPRINLQYTRRAYVKSDGIDKSLNDKIMAIANNNIETPYISVVCTIPKCFFIDPKAILNIGYTVFECEKIPQYLIPSCNQMDAIFTPSQFSKRIIEKNGVIAPIFVIPHCHEIERFENVGKYNIKNLKGFNFLFLSEMTPRKGWDHLVQAFVEEFGVGEDVSLTIKTYLRNFELKTQKGCVEKIKNVVDNLGKKINIDTPIIYFYGECLPDSCVLKFINSFDCIVSPHHSEGFGLVLSTAMLLGKVVVATNYSGNTDFMNNDNSSLVPTNGYEKVPQEMVNFCDIYKDNIWPCIDFNCLKERMRFVYENHLKLGQMKQNAIRDISAMCNYKRVSSLICDSLQSLLAIKRLK